MTEPAYTEIPEDGIDVTHLVGSSMSPADHEALRRYQDALYIATYWPDVENFRACVKAYDDLRAVAKGGK